MSACGQKPAWHVACRTAEHGTHLIRCAATYEDCDRSYPPVRGRLERVLAGHSLSFAQTSSEVMSLLSKEKYGMVMISVHFDESQMFALLGDIRSHSMYRKVPIVCVLAERGRLSDVAVEGLDHAVKAMTANGFLDLHRFPDDEGGNARIRRIVDYLILIDGDLQAIAEVQELGRVTERRASSR